MLSANCTICLKPGNILSLTEKIYKNGINETLKLKLCYIVPEVEWLDKYQLCENCIKDLMIACQFKEKCLNIQSPHWKLETETDCDNNYSGDFKRDYQSDGDSSIDNNHLKILSQEEFQLNQPLSSFTCFLCNRHCKQKVDLVKHFEDEHQKTDNLKYKRKEICTTCGRKYVSPGSLKEHILICDGIRRHCKSKAEHQCNKCGKYYTTQKILNSHKLKCDQENLKKSEFQCVKCNKFYQSEKTLKYHENEGCRKNEQARDTIHCNICNEIMSTPLELEEHFSFKHNDKYNLSFKSSNDELQMQKKLNRISKLKNRKFSCEICHEEFILLKDIKNHCSSVHSLSEKAIKPYKCEICNIRLRTSTNLLNHKLYHDRNRTNICSFCGKSFITKNDLISHEVIHYNIRKYKCDKCEKAFKTNTNLRTHQLIVHTDPILWKHICNICGKRFPQKSSFDQHKRRHLGEKKFSCQLCNKSFTSKGELQGHMNGHLNVQAYKCEECGKAYRKRHTYNVHMTKTHGIGNAKIRVLEKKYACHICPGKFTDKVKLTRHLCTHTGLKPYACTVCDKKFIDKSYLKHHLKSIHKIEEPKLDH